MGYFRRKPSYEAETVSAYEYSEPNPRGEILQVFITDVYPGGRGLPKALKDLGLIDEMPDSYLKVDTYVWRGPNCYGGCNPMWSMRMDGTYECHPEWLLEAGDENEKRMLREIERRFMEVRA